MLSTVLLCLSALPATSVQDESPWLDLTFAEARERSREEQKPLFAYFYAPYAKKCDHLDAVVWSNGAVIDHLRFKTIPIRIDTSRSREICNRFEVSQNAMMLWIGPDGEEMDRLAHDGRKNSTYFLKISHMILDGQSDLQHLRAEADEAVEDPENGIKRVWYGRMLEGRARPRAALRQYLWAFDNCLGPDFQEYRRGDLLFTIRQLFQAAPQSVPEMEARADEARLVVVNGLDAVREKLGPDTDDEKARAYLARMAADAASLRHTLQDHAHVIELFDAVDGLPHESLAREAMLPWVGDTLIKEERYRELVDCIADVDALCDDMYREYDARLERLKTELPRRRSWQAEARALDGIGKRFGPLFAALLGVGRTEEAVTRAHRLLELTDSSDPWVVLLQRAGQVGQHEVVRELAAEGMERFGEGTRDYNRVRKMLRLHGGGE